MQEMTVYGLERLEDRVLLAVDVTLNKKGVLTITGDDDYNTIELFEYAGDLIVAIDEDSDGTFDQYFDVDIDFVKKININTYGGDDAVVISDVAGNAILNVILGTGVDYFYWGYSAADAAAAF
jgi:hypothetical protein